MKQANEYGDQNLCIGKECQQLIPFASSMHAQRLSPGKDPSWQGAPATLAHGTGSSGDPAPGWYSLITGVRSGYGPLWTFLQIRSA